MAKLCGNHEIRHQHVPPHQIPAAVWDVGFRGLEKSFMYECHRVAAAHSCLFRFAVASLFTPVRNFTESLPAKPH
jgi:hypothetical protein